MSQDQDPIDETRRFEPVDPYNIPPEQAGSPAPGYEGYEGYQGYQPGFEQPPGEPPRPAPSPGFKQRLTRLGPLKLAVLGTAGVIVLGGAAWGTTSALQSSGSSSNAAAGAPTSGQPQSGGGATTGKAGHHKAGKSARVKITQVGTGSFTGTEGKGKTVTVDYDATTRFGSKAHPLTSADLKAGMTVMVAGARQGDTITATEVGGSDKAGKTTKSKKPAKTPSPTPTPTATSTALVG